MADRFSLREAQQHFARTIATGPDACPAGLFAGSREQVMRGLKVHANTISHARLVALEDSFPQTRAALGDDDFHALSRAYLDAGYGRAQSLDALGECFPDWLRTGDAAPGCVALAQFEWCWLLSYRAAEAAALTAPDFAGLDPAAVLALALDVHPAVQLLPSGAALTDAFDLESTSTWLLMTRPASEVRVQGLDDAAADLLRAIEPGMNLAAAFETFLAAQPNSDVLAAFHQLIAAGALSKVEKPCLP